MKIRVTALSARRLKAGARCLRQNDCPQFFFPFHTEMVTHFQMVAHQAKAIRICNIYIQHSILITFA